MTAYNFYRDTLQLQTGDILLSPDYRTGIFDKVSDVIRYVIPITGKQWDYPKHWNKSLIVRNADLPDEQKVSMADDIVSLAERIKRNDEPRFSGIKTIGYIARPKLFMFEYVFTVFEECGYPIWTDEINYWQSSKKNITDTLFNAKNLYVLGVLNLK